MTENDSEAVLSRVCAPVTDAFAPLYWEMSAVPAPVFTESNCVGGGAQKRVRFRVCEPGSACPVPGSGPMVGKLLESSIARVSISEQKGFNLGWIAKAW